MRKLVSVFFLLLLVVGCNPDEKPGRFDHLDQRTRIRLRQYLVEGKRLYGIHCANCHQQDGTGLARLYPPIKDSDYLLDHKSEIICGMRYGQKGEMVVNGVMYNQEMPGIQNITDLEIAEIATYIYTVFGDTVQIITLNDVRAIMTNCPDSAKVK